MAAAPRRLRGQAGILPNERMPWGRTRSGRRIARQITLSLSTAGIGISTLVVDGGLTLS